MASIQKWWSGPCRCSEERTVVTHGGSPVEGQVGVLEVRFPALGETVSLGKDKPVEVRVTGLSVCCTGLEFTGCSCGVRVTGYYDVGWRAVPEDWEVTGWSLVDRATQELLEMERADPDWSWMDDEGLGPEDIF